jgi:hypothetical protein
MKNEDTTNLIIRGYNNQLLRWDARKKVLDEMIKDLDAQYKVACDNWEAAWRERQEYINVRDEKALDDPMDDYNYVGSKDHY